MSQQERQLKKTIDLYMEEQRRLHKEVMAAAVDTRVAAALAKNAADRIGKSEEKLEKWVLSIERRVQVIQRWQYGMTIGGIVAGGLLWTKVKRLLGLGA